MELMCDEDRVVRVINGEGAITGEETSCEERHATQFQSHLLYRTLVINFRNTSPGHKTVRLEKA